MTRFAVAKGSRLPGGELEEVRRICRELRYENPSCALKKEEFEHIFRICKALWIHDGDPRHPHAELTAGDCSNGFIDTLRVLRYPEFCGLLAVPLAWKVRTKYLGRVDWVIGSDHAGATFSYEVASLLGAQHDFTEKGPNGTQIWKRFEIMPDEVVLQVEELVTTTYTLQAVRNGIREGNPHPVNFAPLVATLVHRSPTHEFEEFEGNPIVYERHYNMEKWKPTECPLCAVGSVKLRPKQHWAELTQT